MRVIKRRRRIHSHWVSFAAVRVKGRVAVVPFLAIGLHGRVAKVLEKATVLVFDDGLAWIRRTRCSLAAYWIWAAIRCCGGELGLDLCTRAVVVAAVGVAQGNSAYW